MPTLDDLPAPPDLRAGDRLYISPAALDRSCGLLLAGGPLRFSAIHVIVRRHARIDRAVVTAEQLGAWGVAHGLASDLALRLDRVTRARPPIGKLPAELPLIMGIINVTPDSFSDGGQFFDPGIAVEHGLSLWRAGADILDVGGESTRPGATPISADEEAARILPVIRRLAEVGATVSVDTRNAAVMSAAIEAGAQIINDVTALTGDPDSLAIAAASNLPVILMHMQGDPRTMQQAPRYTDVALDIYDYLEARLDSCRDAGIPADRLVVDPGIGFGKTLEHNLAVLDRCALFHGLGCPVMIGASRKSFIAKASQGESAEHRLPGSLAAAQAALDRGVQLLRVHDVAETAQARAIWRAIGAAA